MINTTKNSINGKNNYYKKIGMFDPKYDTLRMGWRTSFKNKNHSEDTKKKIGLKNSRNIGKLSSQFGTCWITNGKINKKINKKELDIWVEKGYYKGRIFVLVV